ncbi:hypothetical protein Bca52824_047708 [Brassica carinata]|uniref:Uncharacterized protein n=1 Tax=Brassica carinata TaxID=52824 RepID=A0A8X7URF2_BRACI|nr:hypothetical protein Bca52824_047708 [Brassica carinata]
MGRQGGDCCQYWVLIYGNLLLIFPPETSILTHSLTPPVVHSVRGFSVWDCGVPWHDSVSSEEFQILPVDERYPDHCITWLEYREGQHSCTCDTFNSMPRVMDAYSEQERSQLALIQRFLVGDWILKHETFFVSGRVVDGREMTVQFHETFLYISLFHSPNLSVSRDTSPTIFLSGGGAKAMVEAAADSSLVKHCVGFTSSPPPQEQGKEKQWCDIAAFPDQAWCGGEVVVVGGDASIMV